MLEIEGALALAEVEAKSPVATIGEAELSEKVGAQFGKAHIACFYEGKVELIREIEKFLK